jgi:hypothetical protein
MSSSGRSSRQRARLMAFVSLSCKDLYKVFQKHRSFKDRTLWFRGVPTPLQAYGLLSRLNTCWVPKTIKFCAECYKYRSRDKNSWDELCTERLQSIMDPTVCLFEKGQRVKWLLNSVEHGNFGSRVYQWCNCPHDSDLEVCPDCQIRENILRGWKTPFISGLRYG